MSRRSRWAMIVLFAIAMAWMESATVVYLRMLVDRVVPYQANPLPKHDLLGVTELIRELATLTMLFAAAWLAGRNGRQRFGYFVIAFGVWDILYYSFLNVIVGWPVSVLDWDVLFLIPLPWWGPVLAPTSIALLMIAGGTVITQCDSNHLPLWPSRRIAALSIMGVALALAIFMADSALAIQGGEEALRAMLPKRFPWPLFLFALGLMSLPLWDMLWQLWRRRAQTGPTESSNLEVSNLG